MKYLNKLNNFILLLICAFALSIVIPEDLLARRGGGGFRGGGRSRSSSWGSSKRSASKGWSKKSSGMTSRRGAGSSKMSKADRNLYKKAKANGTAFNSRADAKKAFGQKYGNQYKSKYANKPATRPDHIPQNTKVDGRSYPVTYDQRRGGYGYYGMGGSWMAYSVMTDLVMMNMLMGRHHYYGGDHHVRSAGHSARTGMIVILIIVGVAFYMRRY
ncbi:MAG: hypothetical protein HN590_19260 [Calditrichaeota bacterium]|nr:hypothetical protein [Calditrichota bacterium]MBT7788751.1 hypothetical protein [Calditrichota bacterium]